MKVKEEKFDIYRYFGKYKLSFFERFNLPNSLKYIILFRKFNRTKNNVLMRMFYKYRMKKYCDYGLFQISNKANIGNGFYIGHNGRLIINGNVVIGNNCNVGTGVIIGQENRGKRKGSPHIGNDVWIGSNSVVVGNIKIGDNVLIAPNSLVNFDVPDNSVVFGFDNIKYDINATKEYINNRI